MIELLGKAYKTPDATLSLRKLRAVKVSLLGEVMSPGMQTCTALQRVSEVIDKAGGRFKEGDVWIFNDAYEIGRAHV